MTYRHTEPLTDATAGHLEAARQRANAATWQQAFAQLRGPGTFTVAVAESVVPPSGTARGSITRTLTVT